MYIHVNSLIVKKSKCILSTKNRHLEEEVFKIIYKIQIWPSVVRSVERFPLARFPLFLDQSLETSDWIGGSLSYTLI